MEFPFEEAVSFVLQHAWLAEFRIIDFLTAKYWESNLSMHVPEEWRRFAESLPEDYLDSLLALTDINQEEGVKDTVHIFAQDCYRYSFVGGAQRFSTNTSNINGDMASTVKRNKVKLKKTYEIEQLSKNINAILKDHHLTCAVDVGAGQGYLAFELLKESCELEQVIAIECDDVQVHGTISRTEQLDQNSRSRFIQRHARIKSDTKGVDFDNEVFKDLTHKPYLMYSLHACGTLSESMVELFCRDDCKAKALFNVACCYNLIDDTQDGHHFPMSQAIKMAWKRASTQHPALLIDNNPFEHHSPIFQALETVRRGTLTRNMKMVACQAPYRWRQRQTQTAKFLKRHFYRASLECLIRQHSGVDAEASLNQLGNVSDSALSSFFEYCQVAYQNMGLAKPEESFIMDFYNQHRHLEKILAFMWTIRALLGPPIESIILYDRLLYIREHVHSVKVELLPVLNPMLSPRNMALIAFKK